MRTTFVFLLFLTTHLSLAQSNGGNGSVLGTLDPNFLNNDLVFNTELYKDYEGSPYLLDEFKEGCLYFYNGTELCDVKVNYDAHQNSIVVQKDNTKELSYIKSEFVKSFKAGDYDYQKLSLGDDFPKSYVKVIYSSEGLSLYEYSEITLRHRDTQGNTGYSSATKKSKYFDVDVSFVLVEADKTYSDSRIHKVLKNLSNYKQLKDYMDSKDMDHKDPNSVRIALNYY